MNEPQSQYNPSQKPPSTDPKDPKQGGGDPKPCGDPKPPDPCADPAPPEPEPPPCPPKEECPPPKPCPDPPTRPPDPCPDPCDDKQPPGTPTGSGPKAPTEQTPTGSGTGSDSGGTNGETPAAHLAELRKSFEAGQKKLQELEPLKGAVADLEKRIQAFEKVVDDQSASESSYKDFYKATQLQLKDIECFITTARCQIEISDKAKKCVCDAIAAVDVRVAKAKADRDAQAKSLRILTARAKRTASDLEWTKKWYDFLKTGLQAQVGKQRDDLKGLKGKITPAADPCEAWFYLYELERLIGSLYGKTTDACWMDNIWVATFLDCWPWVNYQKAYNAALVAFNKADAADKLAQSEVLQAQKLLTTLEGVLTDALKNRRDWILKEIKNMDCCGPKSKCP
jgi:hypothetical protein